MSEFDFSILAKRISELKSKVLDLAPLIRSCYGALRHIERHMQDSSYIQPSAYIALHGQNNFPSLNHESEKLISHYRLIFMAGFLYSLLAYVDTPLELTNIDRVRLAFGLFHELNRDEKIVFLLRYRFKDFDQTSRWLANDKEFTEVIRELKLERDLILAEVDRHLSSQL